MHGLVVAEIVPYHDQLNLKRKIILLHEVIISTVDLAKEVWLCIFKLISCLFNRAVLLVVKK